MKKLIIKKWNELSVYWQILIFGLIMIISGSIILIISSINKQSQEISNYSIHKSQKSTSTVNEVIKTFPNNMKYSIKTFILNDSIISTTRYIITPDKISHKVSDSLSLKDFCMSQLSITSKLTNTIDYPQLQACINMINDTLIYTKKSYWKQIEDKIGSINKSKIIIDSGLNQIKVHPYDINAKYDESGPNANNPFINLKYDATNTKFHTTFISKNDSIKLDIFIY